MDVPAKIPMRVSKTMFVITWRPSICMIKEGASHTGKAASSPPNRECPSAAVTTGEVSRANVAEVVAWLTESEKKNSNAVVRNSGLVQF